MLSNTINSIYVTLTLSAIVGATSVIMLIDTCFHVTYYQSKQLKIIWRR